MAVVKLFAEFFPLFGFYLVKNTIERDRRTGVGEIIATTPIGKPMYTLGKWLSNMAVFSVLVGVTILTSIVLQFVRAEELTVDLWALVAPFLFLSLPMLAFIAALAVLFETVNWLRGGFGNLVYYGVYFVAIFGNLQGVGSVWHGVYEACSATLSPCKVGGQIDIGAPIAAASNDFAGGQLARGNGFDAAAAAMAPKIIPKSVRLEVSDSTDSASACLGPGHCQNAECERSKPSAVAAFAPHTVYPNVTLQG